MPVVKFIKEKIEIEVPEGSNLRTEALKAGVHTNKGVNGWFDGVMKVVNCHGWGQCGTCRVRIVKGMENASPMGMLEKTRFRVPLPTPVTPGGLDPLPCLAYVGNEETMRLACQTKVLGDMEVETGPEIDLYGENFFS
jgi:ferredoxin